MIGLLIVAVIAGEPLFKPTGKYAVVEAVTPTNPVAKTEPSHLHSHLCSHPGCLTDGKRTEWWHDPTKGPVSHNCPKCGREQWTINRHAPTVARSTAPTAAISSPQVVRATVSQKVVYVVGSTTCYPCRLFKQKHGDGTAELKYVYCYMDQRKPESFDAATWNELVKLNNSGRFAYPFFVVKQADGEFVGAQAKVD